MKLLSLKGLSLVVFLAFVSSCSMPVPPPTPLTIEEMPAALDKAFTKAKPEVKDLARQVVTDVQAKDYAKAFQTVQSLASQPGLTKDQASVASRASLTVSGLLQDAESKGDAKAAQTLKNYRSEK